MATGDIEEIMKNFLDELGSEKLSWLMKQFTGEKTNQELFQLIWDQEAAHRCLSPTLIRPCKSNSESERLRTDGNHHYKQKNFDKALELYNQSIMHAPHPKLASSNIPREESTNPIVDITKERMTAGYSEQQDFMQEDYSSLALGYANRSALLFEMQLYDKCLEDINLVLMHDYPKSLQSKLEERRQKCLAAKITNKILRPSSLQNNYKLAQRILLSSMVSPELPKLTERNPRMPCFSNAVTLAYSPDRGRYIIADKDIIPGEVIGIENCYNCSLDMENMSTYCSKCLKQCLTPIPCPSCTKVMFCSEICRMEALNDDHRLECLILPTLLAMGLKPVFTMVFKLFKNSSHMGWKAILERLQEQERQYPPERLGFNQEGVHTPESYESIYHLVTNRDKRPNGDLYVKCMIGFVMTMLLKQSEVYFLDELGQPVSPTQEELLITGETLFANLMKISCNGFQLVEFQCSGPPVTLERKTIGSAVFASLSLINHSCNPSATTYISGRTQVLRAARNISAGEEITESYCQTFYQQGPEERQMGLLEVYQFTCHCEACQRKWPVCQELPKTIQFKCIDCTRSVSTETSVCSKCKLDYTRSYNDTIKQEMTDHWWSTAKKVKEAFEKSQCLPAKMKACQRVTEKDLLVIRNAIELFDMYVSSPCQPLWEVYDSLDLYFRLQGSPVFAYLQEYEE